MINKIQVVTLVQSRGESMTKRRLSPKGRRPAAKIDEALELIEQAAAEECERKEETPDHDTD